MGQILSSQIKTFSRERKLFVILTCLTGAFFLYLLALFPLPAQAQDFGLTPGEDFGQVAINQGSDVKGTIARIVNIAMGFLGIVAVILILYAGFLWMTARGSEEQITRAKALLRNAVIGLVIILSAWGIAAFAINKLLDATGGTGQGDGADNGNGGGIGAILERLTLEEFQTTHNGKTNRDDVNRCSNIQSRFNHWLSTPLPAAARASIKAIQTKDSAGQAVSLALAMDVDSRNNVLHLERRDNTDTTKEDYWPPFAEVEIQVPKSLTDVDGKPLSDCTALGCNDNGNHYSWKFTTTDKLDTTSPALTTAAPRFSTDPAGYPDRNVNRSVVFTANFSEIIDFFSVTRADKFLDPEHVKVEQITSQTDPAVVAAIPTEHWDAWGTPTGFAFELNDSHQAAAGDGALLEPFTWYRVTIKDVEDLCGNSLLGGTVSWIFQTNGVAPGVDFTYPADKYQFACPSTEAFVQFKTSMYDPKSGSCVVNPKAGGLVLAGSGFTNRTLGVRDNVPPAKEGTIINPDAYCRRYDFLPATAELEPNATYSPNVDWRNPANDAQAEKTNWSFAVKPASECANSPYVSRVSPDTGPWGRCLTVAGNYFGAAAARDGSDAYAGAPNSGPDRVLAIKDANWNDNYLTGEFLARPAALPEVKDGLIDFSLSVSRNITLGGQATTLGSNKVSFRVPIEADPYAGPCLLGLQPDNGRRGDGVALNGTNFGATAGTVTFSNRAFTSATSNWSDGAISTVVPDESVTGDVHVATAAGVSNGLPFDVIMPLGGSCNVAIDCETGLGCRYGRCVAPVSERFEIKNPQPSASCVNSCLDAIISFEASKNIKPDTIKEANIKLLQCADQSCQSGSTGTGVVVPAVPTNRVEITKTLQPDTWYQVTVLGGASGLLSLDNEALAVPEFSWKFKTGAAACGVSRIEVAPNNGILYSAASYEYRAQAYSNPNSCSPTGQQVGADFAWSDAARTPQSAGPEAECLNPTDEVRLSLSPASSPAVTTAAVATFTNGDRQEHLAWVCAKSGAIMAGAPATLKPRCESNNDCKIGSCQAECNEQSKACDPKITGFQPTGGDIGTWVTINGCYLGNNWGAVKINNTNAIPPDNNFCASTWNNTQIIAEVAPGTTSGAIGVSRVGDGRTANSGQNVFTVNTNFYPGICRVQPNSGRPGQEFSLFGKNFGSSRVADVDGLTAAAGEIALNVISTAWGSIAIQAVVPAAEAAKAVLLRVIKGNQSSNSVDFNIIVDSGDGSGTNTPGSGDTTPGDGDSTNPDEDGTGPGDTPPDITEPGTTLPGETPPGVTNPPGVTDPNNPGTTEPGINLLVVGYMPGAGINACPALAVEAVLAGKLDEDSLTNNFYVRQAGKKVAGQVLAYDYGSRGTRLTFLPTALLAMDTDYEIVFKAGSSGLRSTSGGILTSSSLCSLLANSPATECAIGFSTIEATNSVALAACEPSSLTVEPPDPLFTCAGKNDCEGDVNIAAGRQHQFFGRLAARNGQALHTLTAFTWASSEPTIMSLFGQNISATSIYTVLPKEGQSTISAEVNVGANKFKGSTIAKVFLCQNPWPAYPGVPFSDQAQGGSTSLGNWTNFSTYYCRDKGQAGTTDDLSAMSLRVEIDSTGRDNLQPPQEQSPRHTPVPGLIKELFFIVDDEEEATKNDAIGIRVLQNPEHDAIAKWYSLQNFNQGSPQNATIDGYNALRDGRTVYVAAPNDKDGDAGASEPIYSNIYLISMSDNPQAGTQEIFNQLVKNFRLNINIRQAENRQALQRDAVRLVDLRNMADIIENRPALPPLNSGSFIQNFSTSVWPSWKGALSADLGTALPVDPKNNIICSPSHDQATCFQAKPKPDFECLADSHIYQYQYSASPAKFILKAGLEYQGASWAHPAGGKWLNRVDGCANIVYDSSL